MKNKRGVLDKWSDAMIFVIGVCIVAFFYSKIQIDRANSLDNEVETAIDSIDRADQFLDYLRTPLDQVITPEKKYASSSDEDAVEKWKEFKQTYAELSSKGYNIGDLFILSLFDDMTGYDCESILRMITEEDERFQNMKVSFQKDFESVGVVIKDYEKLKTGKTVKPYRNSFIAPSEMEPEEMFEFKREMYQKYKDKEAIITNIETRKVKEPDVFTDKEVLDVRFEDGTTASLLSDASLRIGELKEPIGKLEECDGTIKSSSVPLVATVLPDSRTLTLNFEYCETTHNR